MKVEHETQDLIMALSYAEQEQIIQEHELVIKNAAIMLAKQHKTIVDLKKHLEYNMKLLGDMEIENMQLKGKM